MQFVLKRIKQEVYQNINIILEVNNMEFINKIVIYKNPKLSYDLTQKYMGKILITSKYIDDVES